MSSLLKKREIPLCLSFIIALVLVAEYFIGGDVGKGATNAGNMIRGFATIISGFAVVLGSVNVTMIHVERIQKRSKGMWPISIWFLLCFYVTILVGLIPPLGANPYFIWIFNVGVTPGAIGLGGTMGIMITSLVYRAFTIRRVDSAILVAGGIIVILYNAPIGQLIWAGIQPLGNWTLLVVTAAAFRAVIIGIGVGIVVMGVRTLLGYERSFLGVTEHE